MPRFTYPRRPKPRSRPLGVAYTLHVSATKEWWIRELRRHGVKAVTGIADLSLEDAIAWVEGFPTTESIPIDTACDDFDETGGCNGHPIGGEPVAGNENGEART